MLKVNKQRMTREQEDKIRDKYRFLVEVFNKSYTSRLTGIHVSTVDAIVSDVRVRDIARYGEAVDKAIEMIAKRFISYLKEDEEDEKKAETLQ